MARAKTVLEGTTVRSTVVFRNAAGALVDPQTVQVTWKGPGTHIDEVYVYPTANELIRSSEGTYYMERAMRSGEAGVWYTHWQSGGVAAAEAWFTVKAPTS